MCNNLPWDDSYFTTDEDGNILITADGAAACSDLRLWANEKIDLTLDQDQNVVGFVGSNNWERLVFDDGSGGLDVSTYEWSDGDFSSSGAPIVSADVQDAPLQSIPGYTVLSYRWANATDYDPPLGYVAVSTVSELKEKCGTLGDCSSLIAVRDDASTSSIWGTSLGDFKWAWYTTYTVVNSVGATAADFSWSSVFEDVSGAVQVKAANSDSLFKGLDGFVIDRYSNDNWDNEIDNPTSLSQVQDDCTNGCMVSLTLPLPSEVDFGVTLTVNVPQNVTLTLTPAEVAVESSLKMGQWRSIGAGTGVHFSYDTHSLDYAACKAKCQEEHNCLAFSHDSSTNVDNCKLSHNPSSMVTAGVSDTVTSEVWHGGLTTFSADS